MEHVSYCPYRTQINYDWSGVQTTQREEPVNDWQPVQTTKFSAPITFTGTAKDLGLLDACNLALAHQVKEFGMWVTQLSVCD